MTKTKQLTALILLTGVLLSCWPGATAHAAVSDLYAKWIYASSIYSEAKGKTYNSIVTGTLVFNRNGTYKMERKIGSISAYGEGKFTIKGNKITLKNKQGGEEFSGTYFIGNQKLEGVMVKALTLDSRDKDGSRFAYVLVRDPNKK